MHDPMVVAHEVPSLIPRRKLSAEKSHAKRWGRWGLRRRRRTNAENLGQPVYRWWRPAGWVLRAAGRSYGLGSLATIWHVEPGGRDAFEVCKHASRWRWHVWHWKIQVHALQDLRARLFDRCAECGRKGRPNFSHQWDGKRLGWRKWRSHEGLYHYECSSLVHLRHQLDGDEALVRHLVAALRVQRDETETETLTWLLDGPTPLAFGHARRLWTLLGYERDSSYRLVPNKARAAADTQEAQNGG